MIGSGVVDTLDIKCPRIRLCSTEPNRLHDLQSMLEVANYETSYGPLSIDRLIEDGLEQLDLVVVEGPTSQEDTVLDFCKQFRNRMTHKFVPLIFVTDDQDHVLRAFSSRIGTDSYLVRPIDPIVFLSQVQALLRVKFLQDQVVEQAKVIEQAHQKLNIAYQQVEQELRLAGEIQRSMMPRELPNSQRVRFGVTVNTLGQVSGDIYDVIRVDDSRTVFYVADAMGHGVPAGLLTIYAKKGLLPVRVVDGVTQLVEPGEVLQRFNNDLIQQDLSENPFITMVHFTLDEVTRKLKLARGGHPHPLRVPVRGPIEELKADGTLVGVIETDYPTETFQLEPGDRVIAYTDGIDCGQFGNRKKGFDSLMGCIEEHRGRPIQEMVERIVEDLFPGGNRDDDFTLLGVELS